MWERNSYRPGRAGGTYSVEFAIVLPVLLLLLFGIFEVARCMYLFNTLQEVTRRAVAAAVNADYRDQAAMDRIRQHAIFRDSAGELLLGAPITDEHVRIDYLALTRNGDNSLAMTPVAGMPSCPARNRQICTADPNDPKCVRFVRVRICAPADGSGPSSSCEPVRYQPLISFVHLTPPMPIAATIAPIETLGYTPGMTPCPDSH